MDQMNAEETSIVYPNLEEHIAAAEAREHPKLEALARRPSPFDS